MTLDEKILAMKDRKAQDVEIMRTLSMNLWRRINAGYIVPKRQPKGHTHEQYTWEPDEIDELNREYFHKCDAFTEYCEAAAKIAQMVGKPKIEVPKYVPQAIKSEMAARKKAERAAQKEAALRKVGALPAAKSAKGASPGKGKAK